MDRAALERLSRDELIELVIRLTEIIAVVGQQQEQLVEVKRRVAELETAATERQAPAKPSENSSVPPSVGFKANRTERRRQRGKRRGHAGTRRRRRTPDVIVRCRPSPCQGCGEPLPLAGQRRVGRSQVVEAPPVRPVVIEAWQYAARCRGCGHRTRGTSPAGLEPTRTFGPQIEALLGDFHERRHVSYERLVEVGRDLFGLQISAGGIDNALRRLAERARPTYEAIGAEVRAGPVSGSDETQLLGRSIHLHQIRATITPASFALRRRRIENALHRLVFRTFLPDTTTARRLQARYQEHRASLCVFFDRPDVPPTNNASEQDLRPSVIHRKVTGGFRSQLGADVSASFTSLLATARKRRENLFQALRSVAGPSPLHAAGMPT